MNIPIDKRIIKVTIRDSDVKVKQFATMAVMTKAISINDYDIIIFTCKNLGMW